MTTSRKVVAVDLAGISDQDVPIYDAASETFIPGPMTGGGGGGVDVEDETTPLGTFTTLNFTGAGVTATDAGGGVADITISGGGGGGSPGGSTDEIQTNDGAGGFAGATNVKAGSGFISIGTAPATTGAIRLTNNTYITSEGFAVDSKLIGWDNAGYQHVGDPTYGDIIVDVKTSGGFAILENNASYRFRVDQTNVASALPIIGHNSPYSAHGRGADISISGGSPVTLVAADYKYQLLRFTGSIIGVCTINFPAPASDAEGYAKFCCNKTSNVLLFTIGSGATAGLGTASDGGNDEAAWFWFDSTGVYLMTPVVVAW